MSGGCRHVYARGFRVVLIVIFCYGKIVVKFVAELCKKCRFRYACTLSAISPFICPQGRKTRSIISAPKNFEDALGLSARIRSYTDYSTVSLKFLLFFTLSHRPYRKILDTCFRWLLEHCPRARPRNGKCY